jgi:uncharacterized membrane protein YoaK (UPF0700 family)
MQSQKTLSYMDLLSFAQSRKLTQTFVKTNFLQMSAELASEIMARCLIALLVLCCAFFKMAIWQQLHNRKRKVINSNPERLF